MELVSCYSQFPIIDETDFEGLLPLCREYQLQWLVNHFEEYLSKNPPKKDPLVLTFLHLAEEYKMERLKSLLLEHDFEYLFSVLQSHCSWESLTIQSKCEIANKRIYFLIISNSNNNSYPCVNYNGQNYKWSRSISNEYFTITKFLRDVAAKTKDGAQDSISQL